MEKKEKIDFLVKLCEEDILTVQRGVLDAYYKGKGIIRAADVLGVVTPEEKTDMTRRLNKAMMRRIGEENG